MSKVSEKYPLVVGMTTLPSRIDRIRPTLDSLRDQTLKPSDIFLSIPWRSEKENCTYQIPDWLQEHECGLTVVRCERDYGPGTKLLGCLPHLPQTGCLIILDDDLRYKSTLLENLYVAQREDTRSSFSFCVYDVGEFTFGQGADGFSFHIPNLRGVQRFADIALKNRYLFVTDDQVFSYYLASIGVQIRSLKHLLPPNELIYESVHSINQLMADEGDLNRVRAIEEGMRYLFRTRLPTLRMRLLYAKGLVRGAWIGLLKLVRASIRAHPL